MSQSIMDIAPQGDLVVAIGADDKKTLVRVESVMLRTMSPVFQKMLKSGFREGQTAHDVSNPLALPDDNVDAMLNFFKVLHYQVDEIDNSSLTWLHKLALLCDKYCCGSKFKDFFDSRFCLIKPTGFWSTECMVAPDKFVISALIRDEDKFRKYSDLVVRMSKQDLENYLEPSLQQWIPKTVSDGMGKHRQTVREAYMRTAQIPIAQLSNSHISRPICPGSIRKTGFYTTHLLDCKIFYASDGIKDQRLDTFRDMIEANGWVGSEWGNLHPDFDKHHCTKREKNFDCVCERVSINGLIDRCADRMTIGEMGQCAMCMKCFLSGKFAIEIECDLHYTQQSKTESDSDEADGVWN